jgi:DNA polymerase III delta subunit
MNKTEFEELYLYGVELGLPELDAETKEKLYQRIRQLELNVEETKEMFQQQAETAQAINKILSLLAEIYQRTNGDVKKLSPAQKQMVKYLMRAISEAETGGATIRFYDGDIKEFVPVDKIPNLTFDDLVEMFESNSLFGEKPEMPIEEMDKSCQKAKLQRMLNHALQTSNNANLN